jgi:hypothetical protein
MQRKDREGKRPSQKEMSEVMIKLLKVLPVVALAMAVLAPADALAKVPHRAQEPRVAKVETSISTPTTVPHRYRKVGHIDATSLDVCTHNHRYSKQHRM